MQYVPHSAGRSLTVLGTLLCLFRRSDVEMRIVEEFRRGASAAQIGSVFKQLSIIVSQRAVDAPRLYARCALRMLAVRRCLLRQLFSETSQQRQSEEELEVENHGRQQVPGN